MHNLIKWNDKFLIGHKSIDKQHKKLFEIAQEANSILEISDINQQENVLKNVLKELYDYVEYHFLAEEQLMENLSYREIDQHKEIHKRILNELNALTTEISYTKLSEIIEKLSDFVQIVFVDHITVEDQKISDTIPKSF